jgi:hypothetical protein
LHKVREKLLAEQAAIDRAEYVKKQREIKRFGKAVRVLQALLGLVASFVLRFRSRSR